MAGIVVGLRYEPYNQGYIFLTEVSFFSLPKYYYHYCYKYGACFYLLEVSKFSLMFFDFQFFRKSTFPPQDR